MSSSQIRNPAECEFLNKRDEVNECQFISQQYQLDGTVDNAVCEACCQYAAPVGSFINPVVAAAVYSVTSRSASLHAESDPRQAELHRVKMFASRWLKSGCSTDHDKKQIGVVRTELPRHDPPAYRIGLIGPAQGYGLANQNLDIARYLKVERWMVPGAPPARTDIGCHVDSIPRDLSPLEMEAWLRTVDIVMFVERPHYTHLTSVARRMQKPIVCVPNWEWLHPALDWMSDVDLMICPTQHTSLMMADWKHRFGFNWETATVSWPIDTKYFRFRQRRICRSFVYIDGSGGAVATRLRKPMDQFRRKGMSILFEAALLVPDVRVVVYSSGEFDSVPANVSIRPQPTDRRLLYCDGDVCVQPSHWEGLGLPLIECQSSGMPLITTDAPPMNEHNPVAAVSCSKEAVRLGQDFVIESADVSAECLAEALDAIYGQRISNHSRAARKFVERHHSWIKNADRIMSLICRLNSSNKT